MTVVRTNQPDQIPAICKSLIAGGVIAIEITFTVPKALDAIRKPVVVIVLVRSLLGQYQHFSAGRMPAAR